MPSRRKNRSIEDFGLTDNPFIFIPPNSPEVRKEIFTARENDIKKIINLVKMPRAIFLYGMYGVGKSILALETLSRLESMGFFTVYVKYNGEMGLGRSVLNDLARLCANKLGSNEVYKLLAGRMGGVENPNIADVSNAVYNVKNSFDGIVNIKNLISSEYPLIFVVDDLDKSMKISNIDNIKFDMRQIVDLGCSTILIRHPLGVTAPLGSTVDVISPIELLPLDHEELLEMMKKYLKWARDRAIEPLNPTYPFTSEAANIIARIITVYRLTPRFFNFLNYSLLERAVESSASIIDKNFVKDQLPQIWTKRFENLHGDDQKILKLIYENDGFDEDDRALIDGIGGRYAEYFEIKKGLNKYIEEFFLVDVEHEGKKRIKAIMMDREEIERIDNLKLDDTIIR